MKSFIYCRVSTNKQTELSLDAQRNTCFRYCMEVGHRGNSVINEVSSAYKCCPPILSSLLKGRKTRLVVFNVDRLCRNGTMFTNIKNFIMRGNELCFVSDDLVVNKRNWKAVAVRLQKLMLDAQRESDKISLRVKNSLDYLKSVGLTGRKFVRYGYKLAGKSGKYNKVEHEQKEQLVIGFIQNMLSGKVTVANELFHQLTGTRRRLNIDNYKDVAYVLNSEGIKQRGKNWTASAVKRICLTEHPIEQSMERLRL